MSEGSENTRTVSSEKAQSPAMLYVDTKLVYRYLLCMYQLWVEEIIFTVSLTHLLSVALCTEGGIVVSGSGPWHCSVLGELW